MTTPTLAQWREHGDRIQLDVAGTPVSVFHRVGGPNDGEWWTLLHGWPTSSWDWAPVSEAVEARHRTLAFDWPGLGASDKGPGIAYDIDALTDTLLALWRHHDITSTRIVAHDVGTIIAQELLARDLDNTLEVAIRSVTWLNGSLYPDLYRPTDTQLALLDPDTGPTLAAAIDAELYKAGLAAVHGPDHQPTGDVLDQHWQAFSSAGGIAEMPRFLRYIPERNDRSERLVHAIEHTTVAQRFIWGDSDLISGSLQSSQIRARFGTGADLVTFADCSHYPHLERPDAVVAELLRPW